MKSYQFVFIACIITIGSLNSLYTQNSSFTIAVKVVDSITNNPIENVTVVLFNQKEEKIIFSTKTNSEGIFLLDYSGKCDCQLSLIHENYKTYNKSINYFKNRSDTLPIVRLQHKRRIDLSEVVITAKNYTLERKDGKRIFTPTNELIDLSGSISNLLSYVPSVIVDIDGNVIIRGKEVRVQIDGRSSNLTRAEVLQMLPSDMIQNVEIITSPSASEGRGPRINIITKKNKDKGLNAGVNSAFGLPLVGKAGVHLTFNREKDFIYGLYGINSNERKSNEIEFLEEFENQTIVTQREFNVRNREETAHFGEIGYEYTINEKNRLRGSLSFFLESQGYKFDGVRIIDEEEQSMRENEQTRNRDNKEKSFSGEIDYRKQFTKKGHKLSLSLEYSIESNMEEDFFSEFNLMDNQIDQSNSDEDQNESEIELRVKHDYPLSSDIKLALGYRWDYSKLKQFQTFSSLDLVNENDIDFLQNVHSPFIEYEHEIGDFEYEIGFRCELFNRNLDNILSGVVSTKSFNNILPSIRLDYEFNNSNELNFSIGKRIRYPRLNWLNPFNTSVNIQNIRIGNVDLKPQQDFEFEFEFAKELKKGTLLISSYVTLSRDIVQLVTENQNGITVTTPQNIGKGDAYGLDVFYGFNSPSWLKTNIKLNAEFGNFSSNLENSFDTFYKLNSQINNFIRLDDYKFELSWVYDSPNRRFQRKRLSSQYFKLGIGKTVFKGKGNIVFSANDPFNTNRIISLINTTDFQYRREVFPNSRQLTLSFFYRFSTQGKFRKTEGRKNKETILD